MILPRRAPRTRRIKIHPFRSSEELYLRWRLRICYLRMPADEAARRMRCKAALITRSGAILLLSLPEMKNYKYGHFSAGFLCIWTNKSMTFLVSVVI